MADNCSRQDCFQGQTLHTRRVSNFVLSERSYPPRCATLSHVHSHPLYCVVLSGVYNTTFRGNTFPCAPSAFVFHAAQQLHLEHFEESGGRLLTVEIDPCWLNEINELSMTWTEKTTALEDNFCRLLGMKLYREFLSSDSASNVIIEGILLELTGHLSRSWDSHEHRGSTALPPPWLRRSRELIQADIARTWTLSSLAKSAGVHPVHFAQTFRKFYDCTVGDHIRHVRIEFACRQLAYTETPLVQIAMEAGFADQSHFARTFKQLVGMPPLNTESRHLKRRFSHRFGPASRFLNSPGLYPLVSLKLISFQAS